MIILAVTIRCKTAKMNEARRFFSSFVPRARTEPGCIQYDLFEVKDAPCTFYFFEKWASQQAFDEHDKQSYLREFHARFEELLESPNQVLFLAKMN